jgi:hypothetical protein
MLAPASPSVRQRASRRRELGDERRIYGEQLPGAELRHITRPIKAYRPVEFIHDFVRELQQRGSPRFPTCEWKLALSIADAADVRRLIVARQAENDDRYLEEQHCYALPVWADEIASRKDIWRRKWKIRA